MIQKNKGQPGIKNEQPSLYKSSFSACLKIIAGFFAAPVALIFSHGSHRFSQIIRVNLCNPKVIIMLNFLKVDQNISIPLKKIQLSRFGDHRL